MSGNAVARSAQPTAPTFDRPDRKHAKFLEAFAGRLDKLTPDQQTSFLMALGEHIGVRAELGELIIYQGKPYVCIDGRIRQAHTTGLLTGIEKRPATSLERRDYDCPDDARLWVVKVYRRGSDRAFVGWGEAGGKNDRNPVSKEKPAQMAKKRALYDALRSAFPVGEDVTPMHRELIEDAEAQAAKHRIGNHAVVAAAYDEEIEEGIDDQADEVAIVEASTPGSGPITEEQTARLLDLISDVNVPERVRDKVEKGIEDGVSAKIAATWITSMEVHANPRAAAGGGDSADDLFGGAGSERKTVSAQSQGH
jgi:hypothetical protein